MWRGVCLKRGGAQKVWEPPPYRNKTAAVFLFYPWLLPFPASFETEGQKSNIKARKGRKQWTKRNDVWEAYTLSFSASFHTQNEPPIIKVHLCNTKQTRKCWQQIGSCVDESESWLWPCEAYLTGAEGLFSHTHIDFTQNSYFCPELQQREINIPQNLKKRKWIHS